MSRRPRVTEFVDVDGELQVLRDPDGPPTWRQLLALHRAGALALAEPGSADPFTKAEAAYVVDLAVEQGLLERRQRPSPTEHYDRVCRDIVAHVDAHPRCTTTSVVHAVQGGRRYIGDRVRDLLDLGVLVDRAPRQGPGRARELWHSTDNVAGDAPAGRRT